MSLHIFGVRHHGPGCARSLRSALDAIRPDVIVMEGPADGVDALSLAMHEQMRPPVAMLIYPPDEPQRAVYYPLALFSPEWQSLRWGLEHQVPIRLMDLPQSNAIALRRAERPQNGDAEPPTDGAEPTTPAVGAEPSPNGAGDEAAPKWRTDPLALLAEAAGFADHELWWEEQIERRQDATNLFAAILEAMRTVRDEFPEARPHDLLREAHMRRTLRQVRKEGFENIAVVCGAWHAPVLDEESLIGKRPGCTNKEDEARLKGLPRIATKATWIPWTFSRLTYRSGYGAGVTSPGWYAHLWESRDQLSARWLTTAARLLRASDLDASSAGVIEAVRLADALAAMRDLRAPGLAELNESILAVLCRGEAAPMRLIRNRLEIGDVMGEVPADAPSVPLAADLARLQKSLRMRPSSESKMLDVDLRGDMDRERSHLLHRLNLLGIPWGEWKRAGSRASTFHEIWQIEWRPEFAVIVIEANIWGTTVESAAAARAIHEADVAADLPRITNLLDLAILAGLTAAVDPLLACVQERAAIAADVRHLMDALLPLARVVRYSDVRGTQAGQVEPILLGMFERAMVGLPSACASLDDDAALQMLGSLAHVQETLELLGRDKLRQEWQERLRTIVDGSVHALLRGWCCRILLERGVIDDDELYRLARLALSRARPPAECAAWATGLLRGSGLLLLHQTGVWRAFDRWLADLPPETFTEMLPLLRRAFCDFSPAERRQMGDKVRSLRTSNGEAPKPSRAAAGGPSDLNWERAKKALPVLAQILGVEYRDE